MIKVYPYLAGDIYLIKPKEIYKEDHTLEERHEWMHEKGAAYLYTCFNDDDAIAIIGGALLWPGVMDVFTVTSELVKECKLAFHKTIVTMIKDITHHEKLYRMQMVVRENFDEGCKWAECLGFKREALLEKYGPDRKNYYMYARLR